MEVKETDVEPGKYSISTVVDVGNDAFKAGRKAEEQESDKKWRQILRDSVTLAKLTGRREVVDWLINDSYETTIHFGEDWQTKLKEWGIK